MLRVPSVLLQAELKKIDINEKCTKFDVLTIHNQKFCVYNILTWEVYKDILLGQHAGIAYYG